MKLNEPTQSSQHIEGTSFLTLEAFVTSVAHVACFLYEDCARVTVKAQKPSAVSFGHSSAVQITRSRDFFQNQAMARRTNDI